MSESCSLQIVGIDVQAIALALTACFVPALKQMNRHKPGPMSTGPTFILLGSMASLAILVQAINMIVLHQQSWFAGGTGLPEQVLFLTESLLMENLTKWQCTPSPGVFCLEDPSSEDSPAW